MPPAAFHIACAPHHGQASVSPRHEHPTNPPRISKIPLTPNHHHGLHRAMSGQGEEEEEERSLRMAECSTILISRWRWTLVRRGTTVMTWSRRGTGRRRGRRWMIQAEMRAMVHWMQRPTPLATATSLLITSCTSSSLSNRPCNSRTSRCNSRQQGLRSLREV